jgi:uncharacterized protein YjiS (DUF1127 family)
MSYMASSDRRPVRLADQPASAAPIDSRSLQAFLIRMFDMLGAWQDRNRERQQLFRLEDRMLHDIGLDRATASAEAVKPFWRG